MQCLNTWGLFLIADTTTKSQGIHYNEVKVRWKIIQHVRKDGPDYFFSPIKWLDTFRLHTLHLLMEMDVGSAVHFSNLTWALHTTSKRSSILHCSRHLGLAVKMVSIKVAWNLRGGNTLKKEQNNILKICFLVYLTFNIWFFFYYSPKVNQRAHSLIWDRI